MIAKPVDTSLYGFYIATFSDDYTSALINIDGVAYNLDSVGTEGDWYSGAKLSLVEPKVTVTSQVKPNKSREPDIVEHNTGSPTISIHFHYNDAVRSKYGLGMNARIEHIVNSANFFLADSGVDFRVSAEWSYRRYSTSFGLKRSVDGYIRDDRSLRSGLNFMFRRGYDAMFLLTSKDAANGECSWAPLGDPVTENYVDYAISVFSIDCEDETFVETLGRTLGLQSSHYAYDSVNGPYPFGFGHGEKGKFYTLMARFGDFVGEGNTSPKKIFRFSSPRLDCEGSPCGVPEGQTYAADAVKVLNLVGHAAADSNKPITNLRRLPDLLDQIQDEQFEKCVMDYTFRYQSSYVASWTDPFECNRSISDLRGLSFLTGLKSLKLTLSRGAKNTEELASLTQLEELELTSSSSSTELFDVGQLVNLKRLTLVSFTINNLSSLNQLKLLEELTIGNARIDFSEILSLDGMVSLESIIFYSVNFSDLGLFSKLKNLESVMITSSDISDLTPLRSWESNPTVIDFRSNDIESLEGLETHVQLDSLYLDFNRYLKDIDASRHLVNLRIFELYQSNVDTIEPIKELTELRRLKITSRNETTLDSLPQFTNLYLLNIELSNELTDAGPLILAMPQLVENALAENQQAELKYEIYQSPCWQSDYAELVANDIGIIFDSASCDEYGRDDDYDGDGVSNQDEIDLGRNPLLSDSGEQLKK
ncbi:leucine-rich repeat domain-containing protein [Pseudidiomarina aestuarii]|uniref:leucine-rich repeat domain-containing protein n=1 Tax=Pseudidiomarina aestuarii TaxID=624146 RepID=UPI0014743CA3|nr:hypothetical protein [Pseudidiomarina aestuarii]